MILELVLSPFIIFVLLYFYYRKPTSWYWFSLFCYGLVFFGGILVVELMDYSFGYKMPIDGMSFVFWDAFVGLMIFLLVKFLYLKLNFANSDRSGCSGCLKPAEEFGLYMLATLSICCILLFVAINGISFGSVDYEHRYDSSRGLGVVLLFFPAFLPLAYYLLNKAEGALIFCFRSVVFMFVGLGTYVVLSGYRQILIGVVVIVLVESIRRGYIKFYQMIPGVLVFFMIVVFLSFARYAGDSGSGFDSQFMAAMYYLQGDLFPIDAPFRIMQSYLMYGDYRGFDVIVQHFGKIVPRFIWEDKPPIVFDAAGYYTQVIVGYERGVTLSPTVLGEGYMAGGRWFFFGGMLVSAVALLFVDKYSDSSRFVVRVFFCAFLYAGFFFVREGFSELALRLVFILVFYGIYKFFAFIYRWR